MAKQVNQGKVSNYVKKVASVCKTYELISPGDKILVGVSGGKDSLFLLEALAYVKKKLRLNITIHAVHIHVAEAGYEINRTFLTDFCSSLKIDLRFENVLVNLTENPEKAPCFVCSWHRRKRLFDLTHELECNKLALGHHMDDALETLFMTVQSVLYLLN